MTAPLCRCGQPAYPVRGGRCPCYYEGRASIFGESVLSRLAAAERVVEAAREFILASKSDEVLVEFNAKCALKSLVCIYDAATKGEGK